jgi:hypothetical protein
MGGSDDLLCAQTGSLDCRLSLERAANGGLGAEDDCRLHKRWPEPKLAKRQGKNSQAG